MSEAPMQGFRVPRLLLALAATVLALSAFSSAAQACSYPDASQVFSQWGDNSYYELAPDGGFEEGGNGWTFTGGAHLVGGNEDQYLNGAADETALSLPAGGTAVSPRVCVDATTPSFRLMDLNSGGRNAKLRVVVTYEGGSSGPSVRSTDIRAGRGWAPSEALQLDSDNNRERTARISFYPRDSEGAWQVDDLYVDPFARH